MSTINVLPSKRLSNLSKGPTRIHLPFRSSGLFGIGKLVPCGDLTIPPDIAALGVSPDLWAESFHELVHDVLRKAVPLPCYIIGLLSILFIPLVCCLDRTYEGELYKWLSRLNGRVLVSAYPNPCSLYITIESFM